MVLKDVQLFEIKGGISSTLINSVARMINTILDLGRTIGSAIRRIYSKNYC